MNKDDYISISVKDKGIGIPIEKQKIIFERFRQADISLSRQAEGTGLGLHLVNILDKMLKGNIELKSKIGEGSNFVINLPTKIVENEDENYWNSDEQFMSRDERIIQAASIEFSDIYFD